MTSTVDTITIPATGDYRIDPDRSTIGFRTRHLFGLAPVRGTFRLRTGLIRVADPVGHTTVVATIAADSVRTGNPMRDAAVRSAQYLSAERFPDLRFASAGPSQVDGGWTVPGELTVCGRTREVTLTVAAVRPDGAGLVVRATTRVDRYAFGVTKMKGMAARFLDITLELVALRD